MSVTFFCADAPTEKFEPYPDDEPGYTETRPVAPFTEINLANGNAFDILRVLDPAVAPDYCGTWDQGKLRAIHARLMVTLNTARRDALVTPDTVTQEPGCCVMHSFGRDAEYVTRRLTQFLDLITVALQHGYDVSYG